MEYVLFNQFYLIMIKVALIWLEKRKRRKGYRTVHICCFSVSVGAGAFCYDFK